MKNRSLYIIIEGGEGSGKSHLAQYLNQYISSFYPNKEVLSVREPGGTSLAEEIRHLCIHRNMDIYTETLLFAASRNELLLKKVIPCLNRKGIVISDRSIFSSLAWQIDKNCTNSEIDAAMRHIYQINSAFNFIHTNPDYEILPILLDIDAKKGIAFKHKEDCNKFETKSIRTHEIINQRFKHIISQIDNSIIVPQLDSMAEIYSYVTEKLENYLKEGPVDRNPHVRSMGITGYKNLRKRF